MAGTANGSRTPVTPRQAFSIVNGSGGGGGQVDPPGLRSGPGSIAGSDCGGGGGVGNGFEFTKEDVDALLNMKIRTKDKFNLKVENRSFRECAKEKSPNISSECVGLRETYFNCKRGQVDMRARIRGNKGY